MIFLGVDPGASGGLALVQDGSVLVGTWKIPETSIELWGLVKRIAESFEIRGAVLELVRGFVSNYKNEPGAPIRNMGAGHTMFRFGMVFGRLQLALDAAGIFYHEVPPQQWQKGLDIPKRRKEEKQGAWKNRLKEVAQHLYPNEKITLQNCDAILLAEYCLRTYGGDQSHAEPVRTTRPQLERVSTVPPKPNKAARGPRSWTIEPM